MALSRVRGPSNAVAVVVWVLVLLLAADTGADLPMQYQDAANGDVVVIQLEDRIVPKEGDGSHVLHWTVNAAGGDGVLYPVQFEPGLVDLDQLHAENQLKKAGDNAQLNHMNTVHLNAMAENLQQLQTGLQALLPFGAITDKELQAHEVKLHEHQIQIQQLQMQQLTPQQQRLLQQQLDQIQQQQLAVHQYQQQHEAKRLYAQQRQRLEEQEKEMEKRTETRIALPVPATPLQQQKALRELKDRYWDAVDAARTELIASGLVHAAYPDDTGESLEQLPAGLHAFPKALEFRQKPICMPVRETVDIVNHLPDEVVITAVSCDSEFFHPTHLKSQSIPPGGNSTIYLVFLPKTTGYVEGVLSVQTTAGSFKYKLSGEGTHNPYFLYPILDQKVIAGASFKPAISIHNPYAETLYINEIFTSGGFFQLTLPSKNTTELWEVPPFHTKVVINLKFISAVTGTYNGFINFKTSRANMKVHVELDVVSGGIHTTPMIDFGHVSDPAQPVSRYLKIVNANDAPVRVGSVASVTQDTHIQVDFQPVTVGPLQEWFIAKVSFTSGAEGIYEGKLLLRSNDTASQSQRVEIPWRANAVYGSLTHHPSDIKFGVGAEQSYLPLNKTLRLTNRFTVPLMLYGAESTDPHFRVHMKQRNVELPAGGFFDGFDIEMLSSVWKSDRTYSPVVVVHTNISTISYKLGVINYKLSFNMMGEEETKKVELDFGTVGVNEGKSLYFNLSNPGAFSYTIQKMTTNVTNLTVDFEALYSQHGTFICSGASYAQSIADAVGDNIHMMPNQEIFLCLVNVGQSTVWKATVNTTVEETVEGVIHLDSLTSTPMTIPVKYRSIKGTLEFSEPGHEFEPSFPGRKSSYAIRAKSTYDVPIEIVSVISPDARIYVQKARAVLRPEDGQQIIAVVVFDPARGKAEENFMVQGTSEAVSKLGEPLTKWDLQALKRRDQMWNYLVTNKLTEIDISVMIQTNITVGHTFPIKATISQPDIVKSNRLEFGLMHVGTRVEKMVQLYNPSDHPVHFQLLATTDVEPAFEVSLAAQEPTTIPPGEAIEMGPITFAPTLCEVSNVTLFIKNNLTILSTVSMAGEGGSGWLTFRPLPLPPRDPGTDLDVDATGERALEFILSEAELLRCIEPESAFTVTTTQVFEARNTGNLPITIEKIAVNDAGDCSYGFCVIDDGPHTLLAGDSVEIHLSFSPDFTASTVKRSLVVHTKEQGQLRIRMEARMPYDLLSVCSDSRPLTEAEEIIRMVVLVVAIAVFFIAMCVVAKECVREAPQFSGLGPMGSAKAGEGLPKPHSKREDYPGSRPGSTYSLRSTSLDLLPILEPDVSLKPPVSPAAAAAAVAAVTAAQSAAARVVAEAEAKAEAERVAREAALLAAQEAAQEAVKEAEEIAKAKAQEEAERKRQRQQSKQEKKAKAALESPIAGSNGTKGEKKVKSLSSSGPVNVERTSVTKDSLAVPAADKGKRKALATSDSSLQKVGKGQSSANESSTAASGKGKKQSTPKEGADKKEVPSAPSMKSSVDSGAAALKATEQAPRLTRAQQKAQAKQAKKLLKQQKKKAAAPAAASSAATPTLKGRSHEHMPSVDQRQTKGSGQGSARGYLSPPTVSKSAAEQRDRLDWAKPTTSGQGMHSRHLPARVAAASAGGAIGANAYGSHSATAGMPRNYSASGALYQHTQAPRPAAPAVAPQGAWKKHPHTRKRSLSDSDSDQRNSPPSKATGQDMYEREAIPDLDNQVIPSVLNALGPDLMSPLNSPRLNGGISGMDTVGDTLVKKENRSGGVGVIGTSLPPAVPFTTPSYMQHSGRPSAAMQGKQRPPVRSYRGHPSAHSSYGAVPKLRFHAEEYRHGHNQMGQHSLSHHQQQPQSQPMLPQPTQQPQPGQQPAQQPLTYWSSPFGSVEPGSSSTSPLLSDVLMGSGSVHSGGRVGPPGPPGSVPFGGAPYRGGSLFSSRDSFFFSSSDSAIAPPADGAQLQASQRQEEAASTGTHSEPDVRMRTSPSTPPLGSSPAPEHSSGSYHLF